MTMYDYLKMYQPLIFQTFGNALNNRNLSHAYLLLGEEGTPTKEVAMYLAQSLVCDEPNPFACDKCPSCHRFKEGAYTDFYFFDGAETSIKKENVLTLEKAFNMTSVEHKGVLLYVMNNVENMTVEAINALLKFLEEPAPHVYAFLTTSNVSNVLPTIQSRSQILRLTLIPRTTLKQLCHTLNLTNEDLELLLPFYNLPLLIKEEAENPRFLQYKNAVIAVLEAFAEEPKRAYLVAHDTIPVLKERFLYKRIFNYYALFLKDIVNYSVGHPLSFPTYTPLLKALSTRLDNPLSLVVKAYEIGKKVDDNVNIGLLIDELLILMIKETQHG